MFSCLSPSGTTSGNFTSGTLAFLRLSAATDAAAAADEEAAADAADTAAEVEAAAVRGSTFDMASAVARASNLESAAAELNAVADAADAAADAAAAADTAAAAAASWALVVSICGSSGRVNLNSGEGARISSGIVSSPRTAKAGGAANTWSATTPASAPRGMRPGAGAGRDEYLGPCSWIPVAHKTNAER